MRNPHIQPAVQTEHKAAKKLLWPVAGILFALLWASASTATKIGLVWAQPFTIAVVRFGVAALCMLVQAHAIMRHRFPSQKEWLQIAIYGLLNITIYLGCYVVAMQWVTAGIGALAVATNPIFIAVASVLFLGQKMKLFLLLAIAVCITGVIVVAWPLFGSAAVTTKGLLILLAGMLAYSGAAIYFAGRQWNGLPLLVINGWQTAIGGLLLLPFALFAFDSEANHFNRSFWGAVLWLALPVSVGAVQLWLWLLKADATKAGLWLFLCPPAGFAIARWLVQEPVGSYTIAGMLLVLLGLGMAQQKKN